jgi:hypothetical protein
LQRGDHGLELVDVKTKKSRRAIPLLLVAVRALQKHRKRPDVERQRATLANLWANSGLVFTNVTGGPRIPRSRPSRSRRF